MPTQTHCRRPAKREETFNAAPRGAVTADEILREIRRLRAETRELYRQLYVRLQEPPSSVKQAS